MLRDLNCDPKLGTKDRCPNCGQFHLRPGYCQAVYRESVDTGPVHKPLSTVSTNADVDSDVDRKAYKREWMRQKRAEGKDG